MTNLEAALEYLKRGWPVVPGHSPMASGLCSCTKLDCDKTGKHPRINWRQFERELPGDGQVRWWWKRWPDASVIVITGAFSGLLVVDIDPRSGGDDSLLGIEKLPPTVTTITGGGGQHFWFQYPKGSGITIGANVLPGVDWRGDGGYVVAPPSLHASGRRYEWEPGFSPDEHPIVPTPASIIALLQKSPERTAAAFATSNGDGIDLMPYIIGQKRLGVGLRNHTLAAFTGHLLGTGSSLESTLGTVWLIAQQAEYKLPEWPALTFDEVQATVGSIYKAETRKRDAQAALQSATTMANIETMPDADVTELARAAWRELGVDHVVDWVKLVSAEGIAYEMELPDRVVGLGSALLGGYAHVRDVVLNATGVVIPRMKAEGWEPNAGALARLAREVYTGAMRQSDEVQEWLDEYAKVAVECEQELRGDHLRTGPIMYGTRLAVRTRRFLPWLEANFATKLDAQMLGKKLTISGWKYQAVRIGTRPNEVVKCWVSPELPE